MRNRSLSHLLIIALLLFFKTTSAQSLYKISLEEKIKNSALIVEGKVISKESFWNPQHTMIFTSNKIEVYKIFKGKIQEAFIEVVTQGGSVDGTTITASDLLKLNPNDLGIFFCFPNSINLKSKRTNKVLFDVYSSKQGLIKYDLRKGKASTPFDDYQSIDKVLYKEITSRTMRSFENRNPRFVAQTQTATSSRVMAASITSFSPSTVTAGTLSDPTNNILTINGTGFGTPSGSASVSFDDADNAANSTPYVVPFNSPLIISWTDTQIQLRVPTEAGTGIFSVTDASNTSCTSPAPLTVLYSIMAPDINFGGTVLFKEANLMNVNGSGGYTITYSSSTANGGKNIMTSPELATFQRALATWKESAGINFQEGSSNAAQTVQYDGLNLVMFDNTNTGNLPLSAGTLGVCYSYITACNTGSAAQKFEFDIVIRNEPVSQGTASFTAGPCPPLSTSTSALDLETVLLHELGHALNLGHITDSYQGGSFGAVNPNKIMHYALVNSVKRTSLDYAAKAGALYSITQQGNSYGSCGYTTEMTPLTIVVESKDDCPVSFPAVATPSGTNVNFDLAHATSNRFVDPQYTRVRCDGVGTAVTNNAYYAIRTGSMGGDLSISVTNYTTSPATQTSCTQAYSYPVTGVRLAIYQVNACPAGQSFPTPIACRTFTGNGPISNLSGLAANTNYLIYVDGIENTKASFALTIGGIILPLDLKNFTGKAFESFNELHWEAGNVQNVAKLIIQRSQNGQDFQNLTEFTNSVNFNNGLFKDYNPLDGNNYYRLVIVNENGQRDYSKIVMLQRADVGNYIVYPNPANDFIRVNLNSNEQRPHTIDIYNAGGQLVIRKNVVQGTRTVSIPVGNLAKGLYQVTIRNKEQVVLNKKLTIQ